MEEEIIKQKLLINKLRIKNLATFKDQVINLDPGFTCIIGETGSGKSLILEALKLILGNRGDKKYIRSDSEALCVEAEFSIQSQSVRNYLKNNSYHIEKNSPLFIKRIVSREGSSKAFINGEYCSRKFLSEFSNKFIDIIAQHENQKLLSTHYQLYLLDVFSKINVQAKKFQLHYKKLKALQKEIEEISKEEQTKNTKREFILFQIKDIEKASLSSLEEEELIKEKKNLLTVKEKADDLTFIDTLLNNSETGLISLTQNLAKKSENILSEEKVSDILNALEELSYEVAQNFNTEDDIDERLSTIIDRLDIYQKIKRKYQCKTDELIGILENFKQELHIIEEKKRKLEVLVDEEQSERERCFNLAQKLHDKRCQYKTRLENILKDDLKKLNMPNCNIKIILTKKEQLSPFGITDISVTAQTNPGVDFLDLQKVASGGELSRILLSIRHSTANFDSVSIFLFDEIESGTGGKTAYSIGSFLKEIAEHSQVICITHLPQVATFANKFVIVSKEEIKSKKKILVESIIKETSEQSVMKEELLPTLS